MRQGLFLPNLLADRRTGELGRPHIGIMPVIRVAGWRRSRLCQGALVLAGVKAGPFG
jgi:hypothetical protein